MNKPVDVKVGNYITITVPVFFLETGTWYRVTGFSECTSMGVHRHKAVCGSCPGYIILQGHEEGFCLYEEGIPKFKVGITESNEVNIHEAF